MKMCCDKELPKTFQYKR